MFTASPKPATLLPHVPTVDIRARVEVIVGGKHFADFEIGHGEYRIGRDPGCEICIDVEDVSRQHARLTFSGYDFLIENLGSTNGVFVAGMKVDLPTPIYPGQEIQIGRAHLRVSLSEEANAALMRALWDADLGLAAVKNELRARRYVVGTTIATGGMGAVLRARDVHIHRVVAMKVMRAEMQFSPENLLRFIEEARLTGQLEHPNIVPMYELGVDEQGRVFYTMKLIKGVTLEEVLKQLRAGNPRTIERYPLAHLLNIFQKVCDAIAFAHSKNVVHRDLKPENIMIGGYGEVLVMDWGLAKIHGLRAGDEETAKKYVQSEGAMPTGATFHTLDGVVVGTPPYIAPEQARGEIDRLDARTDIYGLGAVLYEILTLRPPIPCTTVEEVLKKTIAGQIEPPVKFNSPKTAQSGGQPIAMPHLPNGKVPDSLSAVAMKALRLNPADRYQTVEELQRDIEQFQGGFATSAENASAFKQLLLLVRRHKANFTLLFIGFILLNILLAMFVMTLRHERDAALASERKAKESEEQLKIALGELRGTAPTFAEEAQQLLEDGRFEEAMEKISYAISQVPNQSSYYSLQGDIAESLLHLEEAARAYEAALQRNSKDKHARENLDLCRKLIAQSAGGELNPQQLRTLQLAMRSQGRFAEAVAMMEKIEKDRGLVQDTWREFFAKKKGLKGNVTANEDGTLTIDIAKSTAPQLSLLRGAPVSVLNLDGARIGDITALSGLPLKSLSLNRTEVADLTPLRGMKLESLSLADTRVVDLDPLRGMPLQNLNLARTHVRDISPLRGLPLRELNLEGCRDLYDLKPLVDCKQLERLLLPQHVRQLFFLRNHPALRQLSYKKIDQPADSFWREFDALKENKPNAPANKSPLPPPAQTKPAPSPDAKAATPAPSPASQEKEKAAEKKDAASS